MNISNVRKCFLGRNWNQVIRLLPWQPHKGKWWGGHVGGVLQTMPTEKIFDCEPLLKSAKMFSFWACDHRKQNAHRMAPPPWGKGQAHSGKQPHRPDRTGLADAVGPGLRLQVLLRIPITGEGKAEGNVANNQPATQHPSICTKRLRKATPHPNRNVHNHRSISSAGKNRGPAWERQEKNPKN